MCRCEPWLRLGKNGCGNDNINCRTTNLGDESRPLHTNGAGQRLANHAIIGVMVVVRTALLVVAQSGGSGVAQSGGSGVAQSGGSGLSRGASSFVVSVTLLSAVMVTAMAATWRRRVFLFKSRSARVFTRCHMDPRWHATEDDQQANRGGDEGSDNRMHSTETATKDTGCGPTKRLARVTMTTQRWFVK